MSFLIPKTDLFKAAKHSFVQLSPDATWISSVTPNGSQKALVLQKRSQIKSPFVVHEADEFLGIWWVQNNRYILFLCLCEQKGLEFIIYDLEEQKSFSLIHGVYVKRVEQVGCCPNKVFLYMKKKERRAFDLYTLDSITKNIELFYRNDRFIDLILDVQGNVRFGIEISISGGEIVDIKNGNKNIITLNQHDMMLLHRFPELKPRASKTHLSFISSQSYSSARLLGYCFQTENIEVFAKALGADITNIIYHPDTNEVIACSSEYDSLNWETVSSTFNQNLHFLKGLQGNFFNIVSQSLNNQYWVIALLSDIKPVEYSVYQLETQTIKPLFEEKINYPAQETEILNLPARDGLKIPCYFTRAQDQKIAPLVILIHGGPHSRESWGWYPTRQLLSNRGYHVLGVNYRGSLGFGKTHFTKGNGEWVGNIIDDIKDMAHHLINQNIIVPNKIGLLGNSFGGFAALTCLIKYPEFFACAVDLMGPTDLNTMIKNLPSEWMNDYTLLSKMMGIDVLSIEGKERLFNMSPICNVDRIQKPLLIGHGKKDNIIKYTESSRMVEQLVQRQKPVTSILFNNEGHQINSTANQIIWYHCIENFYSQFLGGRQEQSPLPLAGSIDVIRDDFFLLRRGE